MRTNVEQAIVLRNDLRRLAGYEFVDVMGKNKDGITDNIAVGKQLASLIPDPVNKMTALYAAAFANDVKTIEQLSTLGGGVNPNVQQEESGYTALHIAVARMNTAAVYALVNCFRGKIDLQRQDHIRGETALHIAARRNFVEIVSIISDEESCDPRTVRDFGGNLAGDLVRKHECFQFIRAACERNDLLDELKSLKQN